MDSQRVSLGCGTLILITLIVLIFGNAGNDRTSNQVRELHDEVQKLEAIVSEQTRQIQMLRQKVDLLVAPGAKSPATHAASGPH